MCLKKERKSADILEYQSFKSPNIGISIGLKIPKN